MSDNYFVRSIVITRSGLLVTSFWNFCYTGQDLNCSNLLGYLWFAYNGEQIWWHLSILRFSYLLDCLETSFVVMCVTQHNDRTVLSVKQITLQFDIQFSISSLKCKCRLISNGLLSSGHLASNQSFSYTYSRCCGNNRIVLSHGLTDTALGIR